jgi:hypothetical protein
VQLFFGSDACHDVARGSPSRLGQVRLTWGESFGPVLGKAEFGLKSFRLQSLNENIKCFARSLLIELFKTV